MSSADDHSEKVDNDNPENLYADDVEGQTTALHRTPTNSSVPEQDYLRRMLTKTYPVDLADVPAMGGGREMPPLLPDRDQWRVDFDGPDDPLHPHNWPWRKKIVTCAVLGFTTFCASWASAVFAPAVTDICMIFGVGSTVGLLSVSLYIVGFASGPIIWGPCSELYGRKMPLVISSFLFVCFNFAVATAKDLQTIMICRFWAGFVAACPLSVVAAAFSDIFNNLQRGTSLSIFSGMVFCAPIVAPLVGAFISNSYLGWRWTEYITGIMGALSLIMNVFLYEESYHPVLLARKAQKMREMTGNWGIYAPHEAVELDLNEIVTKNILRPVRMLCVEPILLLLTVYTAFIYGILYLLLEAFPVIFGEQYGMTGGVAQLPYLSMMVGMLIAMMVMALFFEPRYNREIAKDGYKPKPEARLPTMMTGAICFPVGIFWLCWCGNYPETVHWMAPTASGVFIGFSLITIFVSSFQYIIDAYLLLAASAIAANTILRSLVGAACPLFALQMFHNMGINWAGTLLGCLGVVMIPIPLLFARYGPALRQKSKYAFVL